MATFYDYIKKRESVYRSWQHVRSSAKHSSNESTIKHLQQIEDHLPSVVQGISHRLALKKYKFSEADGILKDKRKREREGKNPRPIVVSLLKDRIVQRVILDSLQPKESDHRFQFLGRIKDVNHSDYSIGGTQGGGFEVGILRLMSLINDGYNYFYKSDIASFFTMIPHSKVIDFIRNETNDDLIADLFSKAIKVEIANKDELGKYLDLFPHSGVGFAQGSSLSAFAGNILLNDFDVLMNSDKVKMLRYVDDLIIMGRSNEDVQKAKSLAKSHLRQFGMELYPPGKDKKKADEGHIRNGLMHLGCIINNGQVEPDKDARVRIIDKINNVISDAKRDINSLSPDDARRPKRQQAYYQSLVKIDQKIHAWGTSYSFVNNRLPFNQIDKEIDGIIALYEQWFFGKLMRADRKKKRRLQGITLLQDMPPSPRAKF